MKILIAFTLLLAFTGCMSFDFWNDLRVTWGPIADSKNWYNRLPRNTIDAVTDGWQLQSSSCDNDGEFNGLRWTHPNDTGVAILFDVNGYAGGVQALVPQEDLLVTDQRFHFNEMPMYQNYTIGETTFFVVTVYFTDPSNLCIESSSHAGNIGENSRIWFQNGHGISNLKEAYKHRSDAVANGWNINNCIPGMGWHNFYQVDTWQAVECEIYQPTCILYDENDQMHGFCLTFPGTSPKSKYFEHPTSEGIGATLGEEVPQCLLDGVDRVGSTTIHFYFSNTPWVVGC